MQLAFPRSINRILITWFGAGRVPVAPGTAGSAAALPICWLLTTYTDFWFRVVFALGMTAIATLGAAQDQRETGTKDPAYVVVDEVVGMLWATAWLYAGPKSWLPLLVAFGLFRVLDVVKPFPANLFDRQSKTSPSALWRGACIILDDVVAGLYSAAILAGMLVYFRLGQ